MLLVPVEREEASARYRRRSGWNSEGDAWRAPKVGRCRMGWGMVRGVPSPAD